ncbi:MAG: radical SAM protein [Candidatus Dojkabacteria bacterium]
MPIVKLTDLEVLKDNSQYIWDEDLNRYLNPNSYLSIVATNDCQMHCLYCINSNTDRQMALPLDKALVNIKKLVDKYNIKECVILGGEPLLYKEILKLIDGLHIMNFNKIVLTTNGIELCAIYNGVPMYLNLFKYGLTHLNVSIHNEREFISIDSMREIYTSIKSEYPEAKVRINTNIWKGNHDNLQDLIEWIDNFMICSDSVRISNLIFKDGFSVNSINNQDVDEMIMSDEEYNILFDSYINHYSRYLTCIDNATALGFVDYIMIPLRSTVIINRNIDSKVSDQVCENENGKINTFKCLVSGNISLSWNEGNVIEL